MRWIAVSVALMMAAVAVVAQNQPAAPKEQGAVHFGFEADIGAWMPLDDTAVVTLASEADEVKAGTGALKWEFAPTRGKMPALVAEMPPATGARSFSVWIKSSTGCVLAFGLQEAGGARYMTASYFPADEWRKLEVALDDFMLSDDTTDGNGRLDPDQIANCMILDLAAMLIQQPAAAQFLGLTADPRTILIDDLRISPVAVPRQRTVRQAAGGGREITLQTFDTSSTFLIPLSNTTVQNVRFEGAQGGATALKYDLTGAQFPAAGALMPIQFGELAGLARVRLVVSSELPITLVVTVEEKENPAQGVDKSNYVANRVLAGGGKWETIEFSRDDFRLSDDSSDENGMLDGGQLTMIAVVDGSAMLGGTPTPANTIMIDEITAITTQ